MTLDELRRTKREEIIRVATKHGASNIRIFGSLARGENSPPVTSISWLISNPVAAYSTWEGC
jgi:hypothetical protein